MADNSKPQSPAELMGQLIRVNNDLVEANRELIGKVSNLEVVAENRNSQLRSGVDFDQALKVTATQIKEAANKGFDAALSATEKARIDNERQSKILSEIVGTVRDKDKQKRYMVISAIAGAIAGLLIVAATIPFFKADYAAMIMDHEPTSEGKVQTGLDLISGVAPNDGAAIAAFVTKSGVQ